MQSIKLSAKFPNKLYVESGATLLAITNYI